GHDVRVRLVQQRDRGIKRVRLTGTGWTGDQYHAVGLQYGALKFFQRLRLESQFGHVESEIFFVEQSQNDLLAPERRQAVHAVIELFFAAIELHLQHDASVLRQTLFADVQLRHD